MATVDNPLITSAPRSWGDVLDTPDPRPWRALALLCGAFLLAHAEIAGVTAARESVRGADGLIALGGGSTIDTAKAIPSETCLPLVSIPTTYSGAEWTSGFGIRDAPARTKVGGGGARPVGIVYEPELTLDLPAPESAGTAMNALAHCAEALYTTGCTEATDTSHQPRHPRQS
jgi:alcohol dehydrogenase class IV